MSLPQPPERRYGWQHRLARSSAPAFPVVDRLRGNAKEYASLGSRQPQTLPVGGEARSPEPQLLATVIGGSTEEAVWDRRPALRKPASSYCILRLSEAICVRCRVTALLSAVLVERTSLRARREISAFSVTASVDMCCVDPYTRAAHILWEVASKGQWFWHPVALRRHESYPESSFEAVHRPSPPCRLCSAP